MWVALMRFHIISAVMELQQTEIQWQTVAFGCRFTLNWAYYSVLGKGLDAKLVATEDKARL